MKPNPTLPWWARLLLIAVKPVDYVIDSINLRRSGFLKTKTGWVRLDDSVEPFVVREYRTRDQAIAAMRDLTVERAVEQAIMEARSSFSGKSRNALCPCGSGMKFKKCCATSQAKSST